MAIVSHYCFVVETRFGVYYLFYFENMGDVQGAGEGVGTWPTLVSGSGITTGNGSLFFRLYSNKQGLSGVSTQNSRISLG